MYNVLIIGAGNIAAGFDAPGKAVVLTHAHAFQRTPGFLVKGFLDKDQERAAEAAKRWGGRAYTDMEQAMSEIDVVCCCVPDEFHAPILKTIAEYAPRLVIAEKPLAASIEDAECIRKLYHGKVPLALNYSRRYMKEFSNLKTQIGAYGRLLKGVGYYGKGILHNGSHMIDLLMFLLGPVSSIEAPLHPIEDFLSSDFSYDVTLKIRDGFFHMNAIDSRVVTIFEMELFFEKVRIRILDGGSVVERYEVKESSSYAGYYNYMLAEKRNMDYSNAMLGLAENVKGYLDHGEELKCTLEDGMNVLKICQMIQGGL